MCRLLYTALFGTLCAVCAAAWVEVEDADDGTPLVIPLEMRQNDDGDIRRLSHLPAAKLNRLITDCNSRAIVRAIRRPNIVSEDAMKLRLCLSLLEMLDNARQQEETQRLRHSAASLSNTLGLSKMGNMAGGEVILLD